jgi:hypothetical protein
VFYCCPGTLGYSSENSNDPEYCCVNDSNTTYAPSCSDDPQFCCVSDNDTFTSYATSCSDLAQTQTSFTSCSTTVPLTASDYSSLITAAANSIGYSPSPDLTVTLGSIATTGVASSSSSKGAGMPRITSAGSMVTYGGAAAALLAVL